ncbi:MAG: phosphoadenylylsulfate reductase [Chitinophagaceae bacterium]|nr:MAG: phosphoadenylylsulfate reductase [Chitinophagaceae bacterium]
MDLQNINKALHGKSPEEIVVWAIQQAKKPIVTTNFRPYESAILYVTTQALPSIKVIWCDTGYNTPDTYRHAKELIEKLNLNIFIYVPLQTAGFRDVMLGIPEVDTPEHKIFTEQVKLEPFRRAMKEHEPDVWFTNLRKGQTAYRDGIDIASQDRNGVLKVSPFYYYSDEDLEQYLIKHQLPDEKKYYDPTKALANRECGIHL